MYRFVEGESRIKYYTDMIHLQIINPAEGHCEIFPPNLKLFGFNDKKEITKSRNYSIDGFKEGSIIYSQLYEDSNYER